LQERSATPLQSTIRDAPAECGAQSPARMVTATRGAVHNRLNAAQKDEWPSSWRRDETFAGVVQARGAKKMHWIVQFEGVSGNVIVARVS